MEGWLLILKGIGLLYLVGVAVLAIIIFTLIIALVVDYIRYGAREVSIEEKNKYER